MHIKPVVFDDAAILLELSLKTFFDAFAHLNNAADMDAYAVRAFTLHQLQKELSDPGSRFYFAMVDDGIAGYLKINSHTAQTELKDKNALEVERLYVLHQHQGKQTGKNLLDFAIAEARSECLTYVWLGVWEHNLKAVRFYESNGFSVFSRHSFMLGNDLQTDLLMRKDICTVD